MLEVLKITSKINNIVLNNLTALENLFNYRIDSHALSFVRFL